MIMRMLCKTVLLAVFCLVVPINRDSGVEYDQNPKFIKAFYDKILILTERSERHEFPVMFIEGKKDNRIRC
jgi:hypothetical protein